MSRYRERERGWEDAEKRGWQWRKFVKIFNLSFAKFFRFLKAAEKNNFYLLLQKSSLQPSESAKMTQNSVILIIIYR